MLKYITDSNIPYSIKLHNTNLLMHRKLLRYITNNISHTIKMYHRYSLIYLILFCTLIKYITEIY